MSVLSALGDDAGSAGGTEPRWRQTVRRPLVVLVLGLVATAVVLLLLFVPFYLYGFPPGQALVWGILDGPGSLLPSRIQWWLRDHTFIALLILSGLVLVVVPWYVADVRQRAERRLQNAGSAQASGVSTSAGISRERRRTSVVFTEDGRVERPVGAPDGAARYSVADLRAMARASGIPWKSAYGTAGGARAVLEILGAVHAGTTASSTSFSTSDSTSTSTFTSTSTSDSTPAGERTRATAPERTSSPERASTPAPAPSSFSEGYAAPSRVPVDGSTTWRGSAPTGAGDDAAAAAAAAAAGGVATSSASAPFSATTSSTPLWTGAFTSSGSVYTPTSLYDAERAERSVLGTDSEEDAEEAEGEVEDR
ncbi:hypothetical protein ACTXPS_01810 [Brachybacterium tyrofermentans]|uniref:hypothetical protein n=1 Tax=Brachybacterium tyrofermentans TaxID=47848 RepID=UPI003FD16C25